MCSKGVLKWVLIVFTIGFLILGIIALSLGIFVLHDKDRILGILSRVPQGGEKLEDVIDKASVLENSAYVLIVASSLVFVISILGFIGIFKERTDLLIAFAVCVLVILALEFASGIMGYAYKVNLDQRFKCFLKDVTRKFYKGADFKNGKSNVLEESGKPVSISLDYSQYYFQCCGASSYSDFHNLPAKKWDTTYSFTDDSGEDVFIEEAQVPVTCCKIDESRSEFPDKIKFKNVTDCLLTADKEYTNRQGCFGVLKALYNHYALVLGSLGVCVAIVEIAGVATTFFLIRVINQDLVKKL